MCSAQPAYGLKMVARASLQSVLLLSRGSQTNGTLFHQLTPAPHPMLHERQHYQSIWDGAPVSDGRRVGRVCKCLSCCVVQGLNSPRLTHESASMIVPPGVSPLQANMTLRRSMSLSSRRKATLISYSLHQVVLEHGIPIHSSPSGLLYSKRTVFTSGRQLLFPSRRGYDGESSAWILLCCDFKLERVHMTTPLRPVSGGQSCRCLEEFLLPLPALLRTCRYGAASS